jgi:hypothetical protein
VNVIFTQPEDSDKVPPPQDAYGAVAAEARKLLSGKKVFVVIDGEQVKVDWLEHQVKKLEANKVKANAADVRRYERDKVKYGDAAPAPRVREPRSLNEYKTGLPVSIVNRSVAKMPVMLKPYGGTFKTIHAHVREKLTDILNPKDEYGRAINEPVVIDGDYVTLITHALLDGMAVALPAFTSLNAWFTDTAKVIIQYWSTVKNGKDDHVLARVKWVTPSGCTIIQEYWDKVVKNTKTFLGNTTRVRSFAQQNISFNKETTESKMQTAFAANVIHSLDASVIQIALHNYNESVFTAVHDCIYGPAGTLEKLTQKIRESFVEVVSNKGFLNDIRYSNELSKEYQEMIPQSPPTGRADIEQALASPYLFS